MAATVSALDKINTYLVGEGSSATTEQLQEKTREIFEGYRGDLEENVKAVIADLTEGNPLHDRIKEMGIDSTKFSSFVDGISLVSDKVVSVATSQLLMGKIKEFGREDSIELLDIPEEIQPIVQTFFEAGTIPEGLPDKTWIALAKAALGLDIPTLIDTLVEQRIDSFPEDHAGVVSLYEMILNLGDASLPMGDYNAFQGLRIKCEGALVANWIGGKEAEEKQVTEIQTFKCPSDTPIKTIVEWLGKCSNATLLMMNDRPPESLDEGVAMYELIIDRFHDASLVEDSKMYRIRTFCESKLLSHWAESGGNIPPEHEKFLPHFRVVLTDICENKEIAQKILLRCPNAKTQALKDYMNVAPSTRDEAIILYRQLIAQCDDESKTRPESRIFELRHQCEEMIVQGWNHGIPEAEEGFLESISLFSFSNSNFAEKLTLLEKCPNVSFLSCENLTQSQLEQLHEKIPRLNFLHAQNCPFEEIPPAMAEELSWIGLRNCPEISHIECPSAKTVKIEDCPEIKQASFSEATDIFVNKCPQLMLLECEKARDIVCFDCDSLAELFLPHALNVKNLNLDSMTKLVCPRANRIQCYKTKIISLIAPHAEKIDCRTPPLKRVVCPSTTRIDAFDSSDLTRSEA